MVEECTYERIPQDEVAAILDNVIEFRTSYEQYEKPDDVNSLMRLFPSVPLSLVPGCRLHLSWSSTARPGAVPRRCGG